MDNYDISDAIGMYAKLAELHDENPFRVKAFAAAAFNIKKIKEPLESMSEDQINAVPGVGKSVVSVVKSMIQTGTFPDLQKIIAQTPPGVLEMLRIKGLGPKKVQGIWKQMGLETVEELFDACRENRLVEQPGFGLKTQHDVMRAIEFSWSSKGKFHFARIESPAKEILHALKKAFPDERHEFTGEFRRCCEVLEYAEIISTANELDVQICLQGVGLEFDGKTWRDALGYRFLIHYTNKSDFHSVWLQTTGSDDHLAALGPVPTQLNDEAEYYQKAGLSWVVPELREDATQLHRLKEGKIGKLLEFSDLKGILHNHSTWSDGLQSLREMAEYCKELGYEYLGICDHSRSAGYAQGLSVERVLAQFEEIEALNVDLAPFKIFKGIESDILSNGSLDYEPEILSQFDLIVASVHSNLKMTEEQANQRLKIAIENPYTHILGHPTGRLLLVREGYPIDHQYIIDACAANGVAIEINANPYRLDLDWRWIDYALEKGVYLSINPDAHEKHGYHDMYYGTLTARKGGLTAEKTLNAMNVIELQDWLTQKRKKSLS
jgi:DNA polymerase (family X)